MFDLKTWLFCYFWFLTWCCTQLYKRLSRWFGEMLTLQWMNFVHFLKRSCTSSLCFYCLGWGFEKGSKTSKSGASKWSSEWLIYYSTEFNAFQIDKNIECLRSINLARRSSGVSWGVGGRKSNAELQTEGFTLVYARWGWVRDGLYFYKWKRHPFKEQKGSGSVLKFFI